MNHLYRLGPLFSNMLFFVPDYQRGYAWEQEQCRELLEDLELLSPEKNHFMGTVILHPHTDQVADFTSSQGNAFKAYDIDGLSTKYSQVTTCEQVRSVQKIFTCY